MASFEDIKRRLQQKVDEKRKAQSDEEFKSLTADIVKEISEGVSPDDVSSAVVDRLSKSIEPVLQQLLEKDRVASKDITDAVSKIQVAAPGVDVSPIAEALREAFAGFKMPEPKVNVQVPAFPKIPDIKMPEKMGIEGWIGMMGWDVKLAKNPLPVQIRDKDGNPVDFSRLGGGVAIGGSSGKADFFTIKGYGASAFSELQNGDGRIKVSVETGGSGLTDSELRATAVPVSQVSGAAWSVSVSGSTGTLAVAQVDSTGEQYSGSNPMPVTVVAGAATSTKAQIGNSDGDYSAANPLPVTFSAASFQNIAVYDAQQSSVTSHQFNTDFRGLDVYIGGSFESTVAQYASGDNRLKVDGSAVTQPVSGTVTVSSVTASTAVVQLDRDGNPQSAYPVYPVATGLNETNTNVLRTVTMTDSITSANVVQWGSSAVATGLNEVTNGVVRTYQVTSAVTSVYVTGSSGTTVVVGDIASDVADTESNPVKTGGIARTANPTAVAAGDRVASTYDDLGRQVMRPFQMRDLTVTAYVSLTTGTEATLLAASAGSFHDLVQIVAANQSSAAVQVDIRAVTAGNIVMTLYIPANSTAGASLTMPWPQDATGNNWTADMGDITGTTVNISALFIREV